MNPVFSLLLAACLFLDPASPETTAGSVETLVQRNADFAARLYRAVASRTDNNICLSTFALSGALAALLGAASGPTRDQLLQGLGLTGLDPQMLPGTAGLWGGLFPLLNLCSDDSRFQTCSRM